MRWTSLLTAVALMGCGASAPRAATVEIPQARFDELDRDRSQALDAQEFRAAAERLYAALDGDQDGDLASEEMRRALFHVWDLDGSGSLDATELSRAEVAWFPNAQDADFPYWDTNASGDLDADEHVAGVSRARIVEAYDHDADGQVTGQELTETLFSTWDLDGDERIDALEWRFDS